MRRIIVLSFVAAIALSATSPWAVFKLSRPGEEATKAAGAFLASLDDKQRMAATFQYDDARRVDWHFIPQGRRQGTRRAARFAR